MRLTRRTFLVSGLASIAAPPLHAEPRMSHGLSRFGDLAYQKGSSLARVAQRLGIAPAGIFAIGDSHNDLEMLDRGTAAMIACPANTVPEISAHVKAQGGYLCRQSYSEGAVEALRHFFRHPERAR